MKPAWAVGLMISWGFTIAPGPWLKRKINMKFGRTWNLHALRGKSLVATAPNRRGLGQGIAGFTMRTKLCANLKTIINRRSSNRTLAMWTQNLLNVHAKKMRNVHRSFAYIVSALIWTLPCVTSIAVVVTCFAARHAQRVGCNA